MQNIANEGMIAHLGVM